MSRIFDLASLSTTHLSGAAAGPSTIPGTVGRRRRRGIDSAPERLTVKVGRQDRHVEQRHIFVTQNSLGCKLLIPYSN